MMPTGDGVAALRSAAATRSAVARRRRLATLLLGAALAVGASLLLWRPVLRGIGAALIAEDALAVADVVVVSVSSVVADAFEAAALYREGYAPRVLIPGSAIDERLDDLRALGIPYLSSAELARTVLERSGVPAAAIEVGSDSIDGTETETAAIAAFAAGQRPRRVLIVATRTHSARVRWLLRRQLPDEIELIVRSPRDDPFKPDSWWHSRGQAREAMMEYLRWINTLLGDLWG